MRYIGGKKLMLDAIHQVVRKYTKDVNSITDMCAGSGIVSRYFKEKDYNVLSNDVLYFPYVLCRGLNQVNSVSCGIVDWINEINATQPTPSIFNIEDAFIYQNYSPHDSCERMYFQCHNALKIDYIRQQIERQRHNFTEDEYYYLLACLISAVPYVANITGTYAAYLKKWDQRSYYTLDFKPIDLIDKPCSLCRTYNLPLEQLCKEVESDLTYLDPPYNERDYLSNYHILETIAKYDNPIIKGVTGMRQTNRFKSNFCRRNTVREAFETFLSNVRSKYVIISYNNEGLLSTEELSSLVEGVGLSGTFHLHEFEYRRYKNKIPNNQVGLHEQLYLIQKW